jgi:lysophospholipase L1-like esterase
MTLRTRFIDAVMSKTQAMRTSQFAAIPPRHADALFLGDSITEGGLWSEWFSELSTVNRGIGGERSNAVLRRMSSIGTADTVLLLIGTNDLSAGIRIRIRRIVDNVCAIVSNIQASQPYGQILVQSVMPRTRKHVDCIQALNAHHEDLAEKHSAHYLNL